MPPTLAVSVAVLHWAASLVQSVASTVASPVLVLVLPHSLVSTISTRARDYASVTVNAHRTKSVAFLAVGPNASSWAVLMEQVRFRLH